MSAKVRVILYSTYGHVYRLAEAIAEGAREMSGTEVEVLQFPETLPLEVLQKMGATDARKAFAHIPIADPIIVQGRRLRYLAPYDWISRSACAGSLWSAAQAIGERFEVLYADFCTGALSQQWHRPYALSISFASPHGPMRQLVSRLVAFAGEQVRLFHLF
jgi:hypothetical protein